MRQLILGTVGGFFLAAVIAFPARGDSQPEIRNPGPGALNYIEGQASLGAQALNAQSVGRVEIQPGEVLTTRAGKAEVLLTPGVFLRIGDDSAVRMISPSLTDTELNLEKGRATVEVDEIHRENDLLVDEDGAKTRLLKTGLYYFDADRAQVLVFDGMANVREGDTNIKVKKDHEVTLNPSGPLKAQKFGKSSYDADDLYRWSGLRSAYVAEANVNAAPNYVAGAWYGPGWFGPGWYWDPWFGSYTFIPGDGIFYSPFGWGFYSPFWVYSAPYFYGGGYYRHFSPTVRDWGPGPHYVPGSGPRGTTYGYRPGAVGGGQGYAGHGGFRGGDGFHEGGDIHGGGFVGGGFDGGSGFGGGFHGGGVGHGR